MCDPIEFAANIHQIIFIISHSALCPVEFIDYPKTINTNMPL